MTYCDSAEVHKKLMLHIQRMVKEVSNAMVERFGNLSKHDLVRFWIDNRL